MIMNGQPVADTSVRVQILAHGQALHESPSPLKAFRLRIKENATFKALGHMAMARFAREDPSQGQAADVDGILDEKNCAIDMEDTIDLLEKGEMIKIVLTTRKDQTPKEVDALMGERRSSSQPQLPTGGRSTQTDRMSTTQIEDSQCLQAPDSIFREGPSHNPQTKPRSSQISMASKAEQILKCRTQSVKKASRDSDQHGTNVIKPSRQPTVVQKPAIKSLAPKIKSRRAAKATDIMKPGVQDLLRKTMLQPISHHDIPQEPSQVATKKAEQAKPDPYEVPSDSESCLASGRTHRDQLPTQRIKLLPSTDKAPSEKPGSPNLMTILSTRTPSTLTRTDNSAHRPVNLASINIGESRPDSSINAATLCAREVETPQRRREPHNPQSTCTKSHGKRSVPHKVNAHLKIVDGSETDAQRSESEDEHPAYIIKNSRGSIPVYLKRNVVTEPTRAEGIITVVEHPAVRSSQLTGSLISEDSGLVCNKADLPAQTTKARTDNDLSRHSADRQAISPASVDEAKPRVKTPQSAIEHLRQITTFKSSRMHLQREPPASFFEDPIHSDEDLGDIITGPPTSVAESEVCDAEDIQTPRKPSLIDRQFPASARTPRVKAPRWAVNTFRSERTPQQFSSPPKYFGSAYSQRVRDAFLDSEEPNVDGERRRHGLFPSPSISKKPGAVIDESLRGEREATPEGFLHWMSTFETNFLAQYSEEAGGFCSVADGPWRGLIRNGPSKGLYLPGYAPPTDQTIVEAQKSAKRIHCYSDDEDSSSYSDTDSDNSTQTPRRVQHGGSSESGTSSEQYITCDEGDGPVDRSASRRGPVNSIARETTDVVTSQGLGHVQHDDPAPSGACADIDGRHKMSEPKDLVATYRHDCLETSPTNSDTTSVLISNQLEQEIPPSNQELGILMSSSPAWRSGRPSLPSVNPEFGRDSLDEDRRMTVNHPSWSIIPPSTSSSCTDASAGDPGPVGILLTKNARVGSPAVSSSSDAANEKVEAIHGTMPLEKAGFVIKIPELPVEKQAEYLKILDSEEATTCRALKSFSEINATQDDLGSATQESEAAAVDHVLRESPAWLQSITEVVSPSCGESSMNTTHALRGLTRHTPSKVTEHELPREIAKEPSSEASGSVYKSSTVNDLSDGMGRAKLASFSDDRSGPGDQSARRSRPRRRRSTVAEVGPDIHSSSADTSRATTTPRAVDQPGTKAQALLSSTPIPAPSVASMIAKLRATDPPKAEPRQSPQDVAKQENSEAGAEMLIPRTKRKRKGKRNATAKTAASPPDHLLEAADTNERAEFPRGRGDLSQERDIHHQAKPQHHSSSLLVKDGDAHVSIREVSNRKKRTSKRREGKKAKVSIKNQQTGKKVEFGTKSSKISAVPRLAGTGSVEKDMQVQLQDESVGEHDRRSASPPAPHACLSRAPYSSPGPNWVTKLEKRKHKRPRRKHRQACQASSGVVQRRPAVAPQPAEIATHAKPRNRAARSDRGRSTQSVAECLTAQLPGPNSKKRKLENEAGDMKGVNSVDAESVYHVPARKKRKNSNVGARELRNTGVISPPMTSRPSSVGSER